MSRTVIASQVLSTILLRTSKRPLVAQTDEYAVMAAADAMYSAYREVYERWPWPCAMQAAASKTPSSGLLTWSALEDAIFVRIWDRAPYDVEDPAKRIHPLAVDASGYRIRDDVTPVYVELWPKPPLFRPINSGTIGIAKAVFYRHTDKTLYQEIANLTTTALADYADTAKWNSSPVLLDDLVEPVKLLAMADLLGNSEQERQQAADLREQAERMILEAGRGLHQDAD